MDGAHALGVRGIHVIASLVTDAHGLEQCRGALARHTALGRGLLRPTQGVVVEGLDELPGEALRALERPAALTVAGLWVFALGTALFSGRLQRSIRYQGGVSIIDFSDTANPVEIAFFADLYGMSDEQVLRELIDAGLDSLPGGGAEIFAERVRKKICHDKCGADRYLEKGAHPNEITTAIAEVAAEYETSTFVFDSVADVIKYQEGTLNGYLYSRYENPTVVAVEQKLAAADGAEQSLLFSSGMAAVSAALQPARQAWVFLTRCSA